MRMFDEGALHCCSYAAAPRTWTSHQASRRNKAKSESMDVTYHPASSEPCSKHDNTQYCDNGSGGDGVEKVKVGIVVRSEVQDRISAKRAKKQICGLFRPNALGNKTASQAANSFSSVYAKQSASSRGHLK